MGVELGVAVGVVVGDGLADGDAEGVGEFVGTVVGDAVTVGEGVAEGVAATAPLSALYAFTLPYFQNVPVPCTGSAVSSTTVRAQSVSVHFPDPMINAIRPLTRGADIEVPDIVAYLFPLYVEVIELPGAATITQLPYVDHAVLLSDSSVDATDTTPGRYAGYVGDVLPELPAAATTTTPCDCAYVTASARSLCDADPPRLRLITFAPLSVAHIMPSAIPA